MQHQYFNFVLVCLLLTDEKVIKIPNKCFLKHLYQLALFKKPFWWEHFLFNPSFGNLPGLSYPVVIMRGSNFHFNYRQVKGSAVALRVNNFSLLHDCNFLFFSFASTILKPAFLRRCAVSVVDFVSDVATALTFHASSNNALIWNRVWISQQLFAALLCCTLYVQIDCCAC